MSSDPPQDGEEAQAPETEAVEHDPDGLDLARALTRAVARLGGKPAKKRSTRPRRTNEKGRVSGAHPDERDPQTLDATLSRLVGDHGWDLSLRVHGVFGRWAQIVGEALPLTHFLRVVRGILLKGNTFAEAAPNLWPIALFACVMLTIGVKRYRQTLD